MKQIETVTTSGAPTVTEESEAVVASLAMDSSALPLPNAGVTQLKRGRPVKVLSAEEAMNRQTQIRLANRIRQARCRSRNRSTISVQRQFALPGGARPNTNEWKNPRKRKYWEKHGYIEQAKRKAEQRFNCVFQEKLDFPGSTFGLYKLKESEELIILRHSGTDTEKVSLVDPRETWKSWSSRSCSPREGRRFKTYEKEASEYFSLKSSEYMTKFESSVFRDDFGYLLVIGAMLEYGKKLPKSTRTKIDCIISKTGNPQIPREAEAFETVTLRTMELLARVITSTRKSLRRYRSDEELKFVSGNFFDDLNRLLTKLLTRVQRAFTVEIGNEQKNHLHFIRLNKIKEAYEKAQVGYSFDDDIHSYRALHIEDIKALIRIAERVDYRITNWIVMALSTALRPSEVSRLKAYHFVGSIIDYKNAADLVVTKTIKKESHIRKLTNPESAIVARILADEPRMEPTDFFNQRSKLWPQLMLDIQVCPKALKLMADPEFSDAPKRCLRTTAITYLVYLANNRKLLGVSLSHDEITHRTAHFDTKMIRDVYTDFTNDLANNIHPQACFGMSSYSLRGDDGIAYDVTSVDTLWDAWLLRQLLELRGWSDKILGGTERERLKQKAVEHMRKELARRKIGIDGAIED